MSEVVLHTCGDSLWSDVRSPRGVRITGCEVTYVNDLGDFGELRVYFDPLSWSTEEDGLIYTDTGFLHELRAWLTSQGLPGAAVSYSEAGMQGEDYVSLDLTCSQINPQVWDIHPV